MTGAKLVYEPMAGWDRLRPLAYAASRRVKYIALSGFLHMVGRRNDLSVLPANYVGDVNGALLPVRISESGQMVDDAASLARWVSR